MDNHNTYYILNSLITCPSQYFEAFITILNLPVEILSVKVVKYVLQGNQQVNAEAGILTQIILTLRFMYFFTIQGKNFLSSRKFIFKSKNLPKGLAHYVRLCLISLRSSEDGNFHNQPELSMTNVFLNSKLLKLSSPRLSSYFLGTSTCLV